MASTPLKPILRFANSIHVSLYRMSGGKFANRAAGMPILLLTSTGRKSGKPHTNPVIYLKEGEEYIVSASTGGMTWHPNWYFNLKSNPDAEILVADQTFKVKATITENEERTRLYEKFKAASENFVKYEKSANRLIPVIRLSLTGNKG